MTKNKNKLNIGLIVLLAVVFICLIMPKLAGFGVVSGICALVWLTALSYVTRTVQTKRQLVMTGVVFVVGYIIRFYGFTGSFAADAVIIGLCAVGIFFLFVLSRVITAKWNNFLTTLVLPILWMLGYGVMTAIRIPSAMRIDMLFFDFKAILQAEALIHSYGLSFAILWVTSLMAYSVISRRASGYVTGAVIMAAIIVFGAVRLACAVEPSGYVNVSYTTGPYVGNFIDYVTLPYDELVESFDKSVASASQQGSHILIFNEEAFEINDSCEAAFMENASLRARENDMNILIGFDITDTDGSEDGKSINKIVWIGSDGSIMDDYTKYQIIPLLESGYVRGEGTIPSVNISVDGQNICVSFAICYDSNFPSYIRQMSDDTDILFLPSWDWDGITNMHYRLCGTISVDNGVTMIKPTYDGITVATDAYGRVLTLTNTDDTGFANVQTVSLPVNWR